MMTILAIADHGLQWPDAEQFLRVLLMRDYNTRVVVLGVSVLGLAAGVVGTFMLLRRQALLSDAVSHATLPGIGLAFMLMAAWGGDGRTLGGLLLGAALFGVLAIFCVIGLTRYTRLKDDTALAIVLSVLFGLGIAFLGLIQNMQEGNAAGLSQFIYGKAASMLAVEANTIFVSACVIALVCTLLFKEFTLVCFDQGFAATQGWPVGWLDLVLMVMVVGVTVVGLQAVGLILVVAMLIIPPAAARFWTDHLSRMALIAGGLGAVSGYLGATLSGLMTNLPTGPVIVLTATFMFGVSLLLGWRRGVIRRVAAHVRLVRRVGMQHLLRAMYELRESGDDPIRIGRLMMKRSWSIRRLKRLLKRAQRCGHVQAVSDQSVRLTEQGLAAAATVVRNHRLWEIYLITHADIAPSHVDRDADAIEHVLGAELVERLERTLAVEPSRAPPSPHPLAGAAS